MENDYINIVLTADNNYTKVIGIAMTSILENLDKNKIARFYIFTYKFTQDDFKQINKLKNKYNCKIMFIAMEKHIHNFDFINESDFKNKWISKACYFRLLMFDILPDYIEKCFFVDGDMIIDCDLSQVILNEDKIFLAVPEIYAMQNREKVLSHCYKLPEFEKFQQNPIENSYFNAGFYLVNLKKTRKLKIYEQILDLLHKYPTLPYCDQDLLNMIFGQKYRENIEFISPEYNVFTLINYSDDYSNTPFGLDKIKYAFEKPKIIHYAGLEKPWNTCKIVHHEERWWDYYKISPWGKDYVIKKLSIWFKSKNGLKKLIQLIFSIKNEDIWKVITILGIKIKFKTERLIERNDKCKNPLT